jgi:hypothetical protein
MAAVLFVCLAAQASAEAEGPGRPLGHWERLPLPDVKSPYVSRMAMEPGGTIWIAYGGTVCYWAGNEFRPVLGEKLKWGMYLGTFVGGADRGLYATQPGEEDHQGRLYSLCDGQARYVADFYYDVCCADYAKMSKAQDKLKTLMEATDKVHIVSPGTDLTFSIKDIACVKCDGERNIPDGEVYTAPVRDSVNGTITYNTPSLYQGVVYNRVSLAFEKGKIVKATCEGNDEKLNKIFDTDEGARYVGEFAVGVNPFILHPMKDTLFDEKIAGSIHFTPGQCYDEAPNGNDSAIHWDMVLIQRADYGGGELYFDDKLVRKDGIFTDPNLEKEFSRENLRGTGLD